MKSRILVSSVFLLSILGWCSNASAESVKPDSQLMVTDLQVVEDARRTNPRRGSDAVWSFKYLIEQMAGDNNPSDFVMDWLVQWERDQIVNGHLSSARPDMRELVINPWLAASGGRRLDLNKAPFKLLAIVNRMDMRSHDADGDVISAGEGRFVFGVLDSEGAPLPPSAGPAPGGFTVILEYGLPADNMRQLGDWTKLWKDLGRHQIGSRQYNDALERLTRRFTDKGQATNKPNNNALNQIRTNEIALGDTWELREFVIDESTGSLRQKTVALTPDSITFNGTVGLSELLNANESGILDNTYQLPLWREAASSIAGPFQPGHFSDFEQRSFTKKLLIDGLDFYDIPWSVAETERNEVRHRFALNTCNGCHRDETGTGFLHVGFPEEHTLPGSLGQSAALSAFMTGTQITDPLDAETLRTFAELERRRTDFESLVVSFGKNGQGSGPRGRHRPKFVH
uniref:Cytochrome c domain-containing protein n=1 Tax=uncultured Thiotrichaceae bacterium TaxID=298394 RepID=A0A6S6RZK7_9GAMM|nr:MAG: Unknown protein [uncultured Thiotrichaceae bacterium]